MTPANRTGRMISLGVSVTLLCLSIALETFGQSSPHNGRSLRQPAFRVATAPDGGNAATANRHPLAPLLRTAQEGLVRIRKYVVGYDTLLVKRELVDGQLQEHQYIRTKIRSERKDAQGNVVTPFGVYMHFEGPEQLKGREVLWVSGRNNGKLIVRESGNIVGLFSIWLDPDGPSAMRGQRYPITEVGIENLIVRLTQKLQRDMQFNNSTVQVFKGSKVAGRACTCIQIFHPEKRHPFDSYRLRVFIDDELGIPIRYASWGWPHRPGDEPPLIEEYTYTQLRLNPGFTERDFDHRTYF